MYGGLDRARCGGFRTAGAEYSRCRRSATGRRQGAGPGRARTRFRPLCYKHTVFQPRVPREDLMQATANARQPPKPQAATDSIPSLAFADADGAKRWVKSLLITGVTPLYEAVRGQLRALS